MIKDIKVLHTESHWKCADGCCDNFWTESSFMYNDKIYTFDGANADDTVKQFLAEVFEIEFEEEYDYKDT